MTQNNTSHMSTKGLITQDGPQYAIRFERHLDHPASMVWDALTQPVNLAKWLARTTVDLRPGGDFILEFTNSPSVSKGKITRLREYALLEYSWHEGQQSSSLVTWELVPQGPAACLLILTHTRLTQDIPDFGAGWHTHLDLLTEVLEGNRDTFSWDDAWWRAKLPLYGK